MATMDDYKKQTGNGITHMSMCGCGFLGVYHIGVATALVSHGQDLLEKMDKYTGASAGSLVSAITLLAPERLEVCTWISGVLTILCEIEVYYIIY